MLSKAKHLLEYVFAASFRQREAFIAVEEPKDIASEKLAYNKKSTHDINECKNKSGLKFEVGRDSSVE